MSPFRAIPKKNRRVTEFAERLAAQRHDIIQRRAEMRGVFVFGERADTVPQL